MKQRVRWELDEEREELWDQQAREEYEQFLDAQEVGTELFRDTGIYEDSEEERNESW